MGLGGGGFTQGLTTGIIAHVVLGLAMMLVGGALFLGMKK